MDVPDVITIVIIGLIIGGAVAYIVKSKLDGKKCIGCPHSATCGKRGACSCMTYVDENHEDHDAEKQ